MTLQETLSRLVENSVKQIPEATRSIMHDATQAVADSVSSRQIPKVGDVLPAFELPDHHGNLVSSAKLVEAGPVVLTFFRGNW